MTKDEIEREISPDIGGCRNIYTRDIIEPATEEYHNRFWTKIHYNQTITAPSWKPGKPGDDPAS